MSKGLGYTNFPSPCRCGYTLDLETRRRRVRGIDEKELLSKTIIVRDDHYPLFLPYFGNHHERLPVGSMSRGGSVSFTSHVGKPLTERLWQDITERLAADRVLVYRYGDGEWTLGWGPGTVIIHLDPNDLVKDIEFYPYWQSRKYQLAGD